MSISTISFNNASRASILRVQADLRDALVESSTNRHADVGRTLGRLTGTAISYRSQETSIDRMLESNKLVTQRLELMDDSLDTVGKSAENLARSLIAGLSNPDFLNSARQVAASGLEQLTGVLNLAVGGQFLFAGTQTDVRPFSPSAVESATAEARASFDAFVTAHGGDLSAIGADELQAYFDAPDGYGALFATGTPGAGWDSWSDASDDVIQTRISKSETIATSVSANEEAFRDLVSGYVMLSELASPEMGEEARTALGQEAMKRLNAGFDKLTALRSDLGNRMGRVDAADRSLTQQKDIVTAALASLEEIDITEAATRVAALQTQLEVSYKVTGMIREINILDYL